jgi:predicted nuclease with TOPRIM domain
VKLINEKNDVRFAKGSNDGWNSNKEEYRLAPNQMKAYLNGTPMEEARKITPIWENGEPEAVTAVATKKESEQELKEVDKLVESDQSKVMTPGLYRQHKDEGLTDKEIMDRYGINNVYLSQWKKEHFTPEEIKDMRKSPRKDFTINPKKTALAREEAKQDASANEQIQSVLAEVKRDFEKTQEKLVSKNNEILKLSDENGQLKRQLSQALEELKSGPPASSYAEVKINQLKAEVSSLNNQLKMYQDEAIISNEIEKVNENQDRDVELENLKKEVIDAHKLVTDYQERYEHLKENYESAMISKDSLHQENITLTNRTDSLLKKIKHMEDTHIRFNQDYSKLEEETVALRQYAAVKTRSDLERIQ